MTAPRTPRTPAPAATVPVDTMTPAGSLVPPLEASNPAGPPEGTEPGQAGALDGHDTPTAPGDTEVPAADLGSTMDTLTDDAAPAPLDPTAALAGYLTTYHPDAAAEGEHPAHTAMRLLTRLAAIGPGLPRCPESYCNLPAGHLEVHGWVNQS